MSELINFMDFSTPKLSNSLKVLRAENDDANQFLKEHHYLHRARHSKKICYAVMISGVRLGYIEYSYPIWSRRKGMIPPLKNGEVIELSRVCLLDVAPKNSESCAISRSLKKLPKDWKAMTGIKPKLVVSYADKAEQGHTGTIYKATGFKVIGVSHRKCGRRSPHHPNPYSTHDGKLLFAISL